MPIDYSDASWWPPKAGDKLRHFTLHGAGGMCIKQVHALNHVVAVFEHDGRTLATVAEWFPTRHRWNYETISSMQARFGYWPDGQPPPEKHESEPGVLCDCCKGDVAKEA